MLKKRTLALLLSLAMLLTFMPAMAFAEESDDAAEQPAAVEVEEAAEETVVDEAAEAIAEEPEEVAIEAKAAAVPVSAVFNHKSELVGWAGDNQIEDNRWYMSYEENEPNSIDVTFSDGSVKHYVFIGDDSQDAWGFFLDGEINNGETWFYYDRNVRFKEGKNTVDFYMEVSDDEDYKVGTVEIIGLKAKVDKLVYTQKDPLEAELTEWGYADYFGPDEDQYAPFEGDTVQVKAYHTVEVHDADDNVTIEYEPYEAIYKCKKGSYEEGGDEFFGFWLEEAISGEEWADSHLEIKFWDDQEENPWKAGTTHEISATLNGFEAEGKIVVNVTGSAAPHTHVAGKVEQVAITEATCTKGGTYVDVTYCSECGEEMGRSAVKTSKPLGHSLHKIAAKPATCQETGVKAHYECTNCGGMFSDAKGKKATTVKKLTIKKKKHNFKEKSGEYMKSAATCTKPAVYYYTCKMCHAKGTKTYKSGKALGHKFEQSLTKATPTKNGSIGQKCTVCGKKGKTKVIPKASKIAIVKKYKKKGVPESALADGKFIEVKNSKGKKIAAAEYEISFENNVEAGTGAATITFVGANYEGTKTVNYKIAK